MFVAMATVVTIGGAYAAWTYISREVPAAEAEQSISITEKVTGVTSGTITVTPDADAFVIENNGSYVTVWDTYEGESGIEIVFTPTATTCPDTSFTYSLEFSVAAEQQAAYDANPIFETVGTVSGTIEYISGQTTASTVITAETIRAWLTLNETTLATESEYDAFSALLSGCSVVVSVSENK